jgi:transposase-like protein
MFTAREHGVTVSDISREIGVVAPNIFRVLRDGK